MKKQLPGWKRAAIRLLQAYGWTRRVIFRRNVYETITLTDQPIELEFDGMYWRKKS